MAFPLCAALLLALLACPAHSSPFNFSYGGAPVDLSAFTSTTATSALDAARNLTLTVYYHAPTGLVVTLESTTYSDTFPADPAIVPVETFLTLSNNGSAPTLPVCDLAPLAVSLPDAAGAAGATSVWRFKGSAGSGDDFSAINETLSTPGGPPPPPPPLLPGVRLWGPVTAHDATSASAEACRDACIAAASGCAGAVFTLNASFLGCWLVSAVARQTLEGSFTSWLPPPGPPGAAAATEFAPNGGRSSNGALPFFAAAVQGAGGQGLLVSVGWSGSWRARLARDAASGATRVTVSHGSLQAPAGVCGALAPGERLRSMRAIAVPFAGATPEGYHAAVNAHRRVLLRYKLPRARDGALQGALVASWSWLGWPEYPHLTLAQQLWHAAAVKNSSSVEAYWLDAGYFNGGFPNGVGNWDAANISSTICAAEFPGGTLAPLAALAHATPNAIQNIVWFEPERVAAGTLIARAHPDFLLPPGSGNLLDLRSARARAYIQSYLSQAVDAYALDVLRLDFNTDPEANWLAGDAGAGGGAPRAGFTEAAYVEGLYALWDALLGAHAGLLIDNCASGGRRIDLETLARSVPLWRSDAAGDDADHQGMSMGLTSFAPVSGGAVFGWGAYAWRSAGVVGKAISWGLAGWQALAASADDMALLRAGVAETVRLRDAALRGDFYALTPITNAAGVWAAYQFHCDAALVAECRAGGPTRGFVMAFRRAGAPAPALAAGLRRIPAGGSFRVTWRVDGYNVSDAREMPGAELAQLQLALNETGSVLVEYACLVGC